MFDKSASYVPRPYFSLDQVLYTPEEQEQRDRQTSIQFPSIVEKKEFWSEYPLNAWEFKCLVRRGIYYRIEADKLDLPKYRGFRPKESYGGLRFSKFIGIYRYWQKSPRNFAKVHSPTIFKAFGEYRDDLRKWEIETRPERMKGEEILREARRLPTPPEGFSWDKTDRSEILLGDGYDLETVEMYNLWNIFSHEEY